MLRSGYVVTGAWTSAGVIASLIAPFEAGALAVHCARTGQAHSEVSSDGARQRFWTTTPISRLVAGNR
jgi:hypothetical protein